MKGAINPAAGVKPPDAEFSLRGLVRAGSSLPVGMQGLVLWWKHKTQRPTFPANAKYLTGPGYKSLPGLYLGENPKDAKPWSWHAHLVDLILDPTDEQIADEKQKAEALK
jgi:hypothetical protein